MKKGRETMLPKTQMATETIKKAGKGEPTSSDRGLFLASWAHLWFVFDNFWYAWLTIIINTHNFTKYFVLFQINVKSSTLQRSTKSILTNCSFRTEATGRTNPALMTSFNIWQKSRTMRMKKVNPA